ncbi:MULTISPECIES: hypothetical protein [unclassified Bradyrhizobium]|uniref:hypothetical protein n=1 Tax=unclassified Bradyrhizobium TaxID=2631580 RepID=UPI003393802D
MTVFRPFKLSDWLAQVNMKSASRLHVLAFGFAICSIQIPSGWGDQMKGEERGEAIKKRRKYFDEINAFYKRFDSIVEPYIGMRQRRRWF